jgi:ABC-type Fe3+-hydroxamate transport system substrate-binding protein
MNIPRRVVSLSPNVSMILFALGVDAPVVGRTQHCVPAIQQYINVWHLPESDVVRRLPYWQALPVVGVWPLAEREPIKALQPDMILTSGSGPFGVHEAQMFGVDAEALLHFDTRTFNDLEQHIARLGTMLERATKATQLLATLAARRDQTRARPRHLATPPAVLFEYCVCTTYDDDPQRRVAHPAQTILVGGHLAPELIQLGGGTPLFVQPGDTARWVTMDEIRAAPPDVVLQYDCHGCPVARQHPLHTRPGWSDLPAVARQAVYALRENISDPNLCFPAPLAEVMEILRRVRPG